MQQSVRACFNPGLETTWFSSLMQLVSNVTMLSIILAGAALIREHGTVEHLLVTPVTPTEIMLAKVWTMGPVTLIAVTVSPNVVIRGLLRVPIEGRSRCSCSARCSSYSPRRRSVMATVIRACRISCGA
jgi:ABC-2 type transport system permease protein